MASVELSARPEPLQISSDTTAIVVNDMQNAFCSRRRLPRQSRVRSFPRSRHHRCSQPRPCGCPSGRTSGHPFAEWFCPRLPRHPGGFALVAQIASVAAYAGASRALRPNPHRRYLGFRHHRRSGSCARRNRHSQIAAKLLCRNTARNSLAIATELRRWSVIGIAINVGVEWTLREAMSREFFGVLVEDATMAAGPAEIHRVKRLQCRTFRRLGHDNSAIRDSIARAWQVPRHDAPAGFRRYPSLPIKATIGTKFHHRPE